MLKSLYLAAWAAFLFYFCVPVAGAFVARSRWRAFRLRLLAALTLPRLELGEVLRGPDGSRGEYQHYGSVEAIQGDDRVWTRGDAVTAAVSMENARIYLLPPARPTEDGSGYDPEAADEMLKLMPWKRLSSLEEGARLYAAGTLRTEGNLPTFSGSPSDPLLVLIYDGRDKDLPRRALWAGRHRNEYWNAITLVSLTAGFLSTGAALYDLLHPPLLSLPAAVAAALAFSPALPFLPPGLYLLSVYRRFWTRARRLRARRDLLRCGLLDGIPAEACPDSTVLAVKNCERSALRCEVLSILAFGAAFAVNFILAAAAVRALIR